MSRERRMEGITRSRSRNYIFGVEDTFSDIVFLVKHDALKTYFIHAASSLETRNICMNQRGWMNTKVTGGESEAESPT